MKPPLKDFDWRNPEMPVIRNYRMRDGGLVTDVSPEYEQGYREHMMATTAQPNWRQDPTYNMKGKRK